MMSRMVNLSYPILLKKIWIFMEKIISRLYNNVIITEWRTYIMQETIFTGDMNWNDINKIKSFTTNTQVNKSYKSKETPKIIWGTIQLTENFVQGLRQLNSYDSASIIKSEANWLQKHSFNEYRDKKNKKVNIEIGTVCYLDFGKTYKGELSYFHYGLCVGKKENKLLIIPITSANSYRTTCYHPINNPNASKKLRQALVSEGFSKDCVLMINDAKFISAGRIESLDVKINGDALKNIQEILFSISLPDFYKEYINMGKIALKKDTKISEQQKYINKLKEEINQLNSQLNDLKNKIE